MQSFRQFQPQGPQARGGQQSTYRDDYKPTSDRPLRLFSLQPGPSLTTHQKMADMWAQYHKHCFQTATNRPRNPASAFAQKGRTVMAAMLESERERMAKTQVEKTGPGQKGPGQITPHRSNGEEGRPAVSSPSAPSSTASGHKQVSLSLSRTSMHNSGPARPGPARKEAWTQATGDPALGSTPGVESERPAGRLPHIGSEEDGDAQTPLQVEEFMAEQFRRDMTHSARLEGQINQRIATQSALMHLGLPFDGVTTYSQSYTHQNNTSTFRGPHHILPEATPNWRPWLSEYSERYQGPERYVPGKRKPPSGLEKGHLEPSPSQPSGLTGPQTHKHPRSEYQRQYSTGGYHGGAGVNTAQQRRTNPVQDQPRHSPWKQLSA